MAVLCALTAATSSRAQVVVGFGGGANRSNFSVTEAGVAPAVPYDSRTGLVVSGLIGVRATPWLTVQLEARYSQEGTRQTEEGLTASLRLSYLHLPLVARFNVPGKDWPVRPFLGAGGFVGFETKCGLEASGALSLEIGCDAAEIDPPSTVYGVLFGGGADVPVGRGAVSLGIEYSLGLQNLADDPGVDGFSRVLGFVVGYRLEL
jgi:hypothetical protein